MTFKKSTFKTKKQSHISRLKKKNCMIVSIDAEKVVDKIEHLYMIKCLRKIGIEGNFLNLMKNNYLKKNKKNTAIIILNGEKLDAFSLTSGSINCPNFSIYCSGPLTLLSYFKMT